MIPVLYESYEKTFQSNGLGRLSDAVACLVSERLNDFYTLTLTYPSDGHHATRLEAGNLISVTTLEGAQPFRIAEVTKNLDGTIEVTANHISYDLSGYPVRGISASTAAGAVAALDTQSIITSGFNFWTNLIVSKDISLVEARSIRAAMGGSDESILGIYGGEWRFDRFNVQLLTQRGEDKGVTIRYGKNLTDFQMVSSNEADYTGCLAYYFNNGTYVSSNIQYIDSAAVPQKILITDHSGDFDSTPTTAQLNTAAQADKALALGITNSLTVSFAPLWQSDEYKSLTPIESVMLGDYVTVIYEKYGVEAKLEVVQTDYNVLLDRYDSIELGAIRPTLADTIANLGKK